MFDNNEIRRKAEGKLKRLNYTTDRFENKDLDNLIHELTVHHIELEMQNEELRRTQLELEQTKNQYKFLYDMAPNGYVTYNNDSKIIKINHRAASMMGESIENLVDGDLTLYIHPDSQDDFYFHLKSVMETSEKVRTEIKLKTADDKTLHTLFESISADTFLHIDKQWIFTSIIDITLMKKMESILVEKNRELNDFTHRVSHNLKNPVNIIKSYLLLIKEDPSQLEELYPKIEKKTDYLLTFISNLLKLSRKGKIIGKKENIDLNRLFKNNFNKINNEKIPGEVIITNELPAILADLPSITEVVTNLLDNSIKYRDTQKEKLTITIDTEKSEDKVKLYYRDNGKGVASENLKRLFNPGFSLNGKEGNGFGLTIIRKIIEAHNGRINVDSEGEGKGILFTVELPLA